MELADKAADGDPSNLPALVAALDDPHPVLRYWAATGCLILRDKAAPARAGLRERLSDDWADVRVAAAEAIAHLGEQEAALKTLEAVLRDGNLHEAHGRRKRGSTSCARLDTSRWPALGNGQKSGVWRARRPYPALPLARTAMNRGCALACECLPPSHERYPNYEKPGSGLSRCACVLSGHRLVRSSLAGREAEHRLRHHRRSRLWRPGMHGQSRDQDAAYRPACGGIVAAHRLSRGPTCSPTRGRCSPGTGPTAPACGTRSMAARCSVRMKSLSGSSSRTTATPLGMFGKWHLGDNYPYRARGPRFHRGLPPRRRGRRTDSRPVGQRLLRRPLLPQRTGRRRTRLLHGCVLRAGATFHSPLRRARTAVLRLYSPNAPHGPLHAPQGTSISIEGRTRPSPPSMA